MTNNLQGGVLTTEIIDDGPKWRAIILLVLGASLLLALSIIVIYYVSRLPIENGAAIALREKQIINDSLRPYKIFLWQVIFISIAAATLAVPVAAWAFTIAYIVKSYDLITKRNIQPVSYKPQISTQPAEKLLESKFEDNYSSEQQGGSSQNDNGLHTGTWYRIERKVGDDYRP